MRLLSRADVLEFSNGQVTSTNLFLRNNEPDPNGLFSKEIFGITPKERKERFGHIELNCRVFHPHILRLFRNAYRKEYDLAYNMLPYYFDEKQKTIIEIEEEKLKEFDPSQIYYGFYGIIQLLHKFPEKETKTAQEFWSILNKYGLKYCVIDLIPVIPIFFRDYKNQYQYDQINDVYLNILKSSHYVINIDRSDRNKYSLAINYMQKHIYDLYEYIEAKVHKKTGAIRQFLLGKRVDFSGRSVIVVNPKLKPDSIGVPFRMCVSLFEPWIIRRLVHEHNIPLPEAVESLQKIAKGFHVDKSLLDKIYQVTKQVSESRHILIKRDPSLHRGSIQAFKVVMVDGNAIHLNPLQTSSFNADFDGDCLLSNVSLILKPLNRKNSVNGEQKIMEITKNILELKDVEVEI